MLGAEVQQPVPARRRCGHPMRWLLSFGFFAMPGLRGLLIHFRRLRAACHMLATCHIGATCYIGSRQFTKCFMVIIFAY
jgi:hypothetical protein